MNTEEQTKNEGVQLLERCLKTPEPFIKWLSLQPKRKYVGQCLASSTCPIAKFLGWYTEKDFMVTQGLVYQKGNPFVSITTPHWSRRFVKRLDEAFDKGFGAAPVTALQCVRVLNKVLKESNLMS